MEKKLVQVKINIELFERLQRAAKLDDRSVTNFVTKLINRELAVKEDKPNADV